MLIKVTQEHIKNGKCFSGEYCPVALALKDLFPKTFVSVGYSSLKVGTTVVMISSQDVRDKILDFDLGEGMKPFEFECFGL